MVPGYPGAAVVVSDLPQLINFVISRHARHSRIYALALLYHVMARGNNGQKVFLDAGDFFDG